MAGVRKANDDFIESFSVELLGKFERLGKLITHSPSIGSYHEEVVKTVIGNFLSNRWSTKHGFIYQDHDHVSAQIDVILVDENSPSAYVFKSGDFAVVMPESVAAVIEIKTKIDKDRFSGSILNVESAKHLAEFPNHIRGLVFSYDSSEPTAERLSEWFANDKLSSKRAPYAPEAIYICKKNLLLYQHDGTQFQRGGKYYKSLTMPLAGDKTSPLRVFLASLVVACEDRDKRAHGRLGAPGTLVSLLAAGQVQESNEKYELGKGLV